VHFFIWVVKQGGKYRAQVRGHGRVLAESVYPEPLADAIHRAARWNHLTRLPISYIPKEPAPAPNVA
jgi:hypothetical protein